MSGATRRAGSCCLLISASFSVNELMTMAIEDMAIISPASSGRKTTPQTLNTPAAIGMLTTL